MKACASSLWPAMLAAMILGLVAASPAAAQRTDVITLVNGDTLTCEIKTLSRARLTVDTDNMSTVIVEWDKVAMVVARRAFQIETTTGVRGVGELVSRASGSVDVITATQTMPLRLIDIVSIAPIGDGFLARLEGSLDFGLSYTQSSGVAQLNLNSSVRFRRPSFQMNLTASSYLTRQPEVDASARHTVNLNYTRPFGVYWEALGAGGFESNRDLGYDLRSTVSAAVNRILIQSNRAKIAAGAGLSTNHEQPVGGEAVQNLDFLLAVQQSFFTYDFPKTEITTQVAAYPGLSQWGRFRLQFDGKLKREIVRDFTVGLTIYDSFDNRPPTTAARKNDVGLSVNVGWSF